MTDEATPVTIVDTHRPVPVVITESPPPAPLATVERGQGLSATPTSTEEEDRHSAGQRQINRKWENIQAFAAVSVISTACLCVLLLVWRAEYALGIGLISTMSSQITTFYFLRTNHEKIGGVQVGQMGR